MKSHVYNHSTPVSEKVKDIKGLDWNRQWDIITSTGEKYVSMTITGIEMTDLYLCTPEVPGYEQICMVGTTVVNILAIRLIKESPTRQAYLYRGNVMSLFWEVKYLSLQEEKHFLVESFDSVLYRLLCRTSGRAWIWGNGVAFCIELDESGVCHLSTHKSSHFAFTHDHYVSDGYEG